jgi:asparagine synthase (glutamine-hydrolysing)
MIDVRTAEGMPREVGVDPALVAALDRALLAATVKTLGNERPVGVLFSGGLDSSFLAAFLSTRWSVTLETIGVPGSPDFLAAQEGAQLLGLPWVFHEVGLEDLRRVRLRFRAELAGLREPRRGVAIAFALAVEEAGSPILVCGQGADELFFGYAHYRGQSAEVRRRRRAEDLNRLEGGDWPLAQHLAAACGRTVVAPFLDPQLVALVLQLPSEFAEEGVENKQLLRGWARWRGLPPTLANRPKRALQYGSGVSKLLEREDRRRPTYSR